MTAPKNLTTHQELSRGLPPGYTEAPVYLYCAKCNVGITDFLGAHCPKCKREIQPQEDDA